MDYINKGQKKSRNSINKYNQIDSKGSRYKDYNNKTNQNDSGILPKGYLEKGYFDDEGNLYKELILTHAEEIARKFGASPKKSERLTNGQLRKFYGHVVNAQQAFKIDNNKGIFLNRIRQLDSSVAEASGKGKVPEIFKKFIKRNIQEIESVEDINKGFIVHFQAVVGYFSGYNK